jgi:hypothetical protein
MLNTQVAVLVKALDDLAVFVPVLVLVPRMTKVLKVVDVVR